MRWPFRRKGAAAAPEAAASQADSGALPASASRRSTHHWATLPPLPVTIKPSAPLVIGPAPVLEPLPGPRKWVGEPIPPATGHVEGLVHPVPIRPEPPVARVAEPAIPTAEPPLVHRPVQSGPPEPVSSLTDAVGSYVGEPREPAEPYRAPGWLRFVPEWLQQGGTSEGHLDLGATQPEPVTPPPIPAPPPVLPQRLSEEPAAPEPVTESRVDSVVSEPVARPRRRANLGQSRRLGLGAPLKHGSDQELILPAEPARIDQPQVPQAIESAAPAVTPMPPAEPAEDSTEEAPEPPPAPPPPALVHKPAPTTRTEEPFDVAEEPVREPTPPPGPVPTVKPAKPSGGTPAMHTAPLVYRATPAKPDAAAKPVVRRAAVKVPTSMVSAIRGSHGVDLADVPVHRGPEVSAEARSLGARAFTRDAEVFLPEEAGSLDNPKARGLLAHELVHVVQQRTLGGSLPALSTSAAAALEAEAVAAEHEHTGSIIHSGHSGHAEPAAPLVHPVLTQVLSQAARTAGVQMAPLFSEPVSFSEPTPAVSATSAAPVVTEATSLSEPVRQEINQITEFQAIRVLEQWTNPELGGSGFSSGAASQQPFPTMLPEIPSPATVPGSSGPEAGGTPPGPEEAELANQVLQVVNLDRAAKGEPGLAALDATTMDQIRRTIAEQTAIATQRTMTLSTATAAATQSSMLQELQISQNGQQPEAASSTPEPQPDAEPSVSDYFTMPQPQPERPHEDNAALRDGRIDLERIDLDDLSARLYDRLRSRLRLELLIDRERAGLLSDFR